MNSNPKLYSINHTSVILNRICPQFNLMAVVLIVGFFLIAQSAAGQSLPDVSNIMKPNPDLGVPSGSDYFTPPVDSSTPASGAPILTEWSRVAGIDESVVFTGENLTSVLRFMGYGQTTLTVKRGSIVLLKFSCGEKSIILKAPVTLTAGTSKKFMYL